MEVSPSSVAENTSAYLLNMDENYQQRVTGQNLEKCTRSPDDVFAGARRKTNIKKADIGESSHWHRIGHIDFDQEMESDVSDDEDGKEMNVFFKTAGTSVVTQSYLPLNKTKDNTGERLATRKRNITKADISEPSEFRHIAHVGFDPMAGFDVNGEDEELNESFKGAGKSQTQLQDRDTREFIHDFICKNGGRESAVQQVKQTVPDINSKSSITKNDISEPSQFRHLTHFGFHSQMSSEVDEDKHDKQLKEYFKKASILHTQLQDLNTSEFVYDVLYDHCGNGAAAQVITPTEPSD